MENVKYDPSFCLQLVRMMRDGHTFEDVTKTFGIDVATLMAWREKYPDFDKAVKDGEWWQCALEGDDIIPPCCMASKDPDFDKSLL